MSIQTYYCKRLNKHITTDRIEDKIVINCKKYYDLPPKGEFSTTFTCFQGFWQNKKCLLQELLKEEQILQETKK